MLIFIVPHVVETLQASKCADDTTLHADSSRSRKQTSDNKLEKYLIHWLCMRFLYPAKVRLPPYPMERRTHGADYDIGRARG